LRGFARETLAGFDLDGEKFRHRRMRSSYDTRNWEIEFLRTQDVLRGKFFGITEEAKRVRFPIRMLRYWFAYHLLAEEYARVGRPLRVLELGIHNGQMRLFARLAAEQVRDRTRAPHWSWWLGVDAVPKRKILRIATYEEVLQADIESSHCQLPYSFDTAICLHIFEHTSDPGAAMQKVAAALRPGGSMIGGSPVLPNFLIGLRERQLRRSAERFGHVSVFSPARVRELAEKAGLTIEFLSGAYFMRHKGFVCENSRSWLRFNLKWGRTFPWWPGEIHWLARKPG
jgi:SAM-dependent methyltransferase